MRRLTMPTLLTTAALVAVPADGVARADPVPVFPGMEIRQGGHVCTLGYVDPGARVGYTAGHCRGDGPVTDRDGQAIGRLAGFRDTTPAGTSVGSDQVIADYEVIALAEDVAASDVLPDGRRLESDPGVQLRPGEPVCHYGIATGESCGTVESVNNGWFTMAHGAVSQRGDSGGPVYLAGPAGPARIVGVFTSIWGEYPAAMAWPAVLAASPDPGQEQP